jgi:hypothetical protein
MSEREVFADCTPQGMHASVTQALQDAAYSGQFGTKSNNSDSRYKEQRDIDKRTPFFGEPRDKTNPPTFPEKEAPTCTGMKPDTPDVTEDKGHIVFRPIDHTRPYPERRSSPCSPRPDVWTSPDFAPLPLPGPGRFSLKDKSADYIPLSDLEQLTRWRGFNHK